MVVIAKEAGHLAINHFESNREKGDGQISKFSVDQPDGMMSEQGRRDDPPGAEAARIRRVKARERTPDRAVKPRTYHRSSTRLRVSVLSVSDQVRCEGQLSRSGLRAHFGNIAGSHCA